VPRLEARFTGPADRIMAWADEFRRLRVRTNADTPQDARVARKFGAEGIGLCRTEHMFFEGQRIDRVRTMILSESPQERSAILAEILELQKGDFAEIFRAMEGLPVTVRLLDPPLHEFLPSEPAEIAALATRLGRDAHTLALAVRDLHEVNPMLGHRGCRLGVTAPDIYKMQVRAIIEAALLVKAEGLVVLPEIMIPLVATKKELALLAQELVEVADQVFAEKGARLDYLVGTMIELPRACVVAKEIAEVAQFFSFGTNDLTQMTFGMSRDDSGKFLPQYMARGIFARDPFEAIDREGVGALMQMAVERGRSQRKDLKVGICGEHGGEPTSVAFCHELGLDYVSCSPYRVPVARLAAAQAALEGSYSTEI
jgi:pyruvate,orthophosphate dikinase